MAHVPVMVEEVLKFLDPKPNQNFVDCTLGDGGHARAILERTAPNGKLLGIDADAEAIAWNMEHGTWNKSLIAVNENFRNLARVVEALRQAQGIKFLVHGILLDLGFSSSTLERGRGFSFEKDELLDMRFDTRSGIRAAEIVNSWNQKQLAELFEEYGEEKLAREIANKIVAERKKKPIVTTKQLVETIFMAYREKLGIRHPERSEGSRPNGRNVHAREILRGVNPDQSVGAQNDKNFGKIPWIGGIHPATRTFQSLRIAVNDELGALQEVLPQAVGILEPGGRLTIITFHSLEDRIVKQFFRQWADVKMKLLTKKPVVPTQEEIKRNPRARSAKLRVIEKLS